LLGEEVFVGISWLDLFVATPGDRPRVKTEEIRRQVLAIAEELKREIEDSKQASDPKQPGSIFLREPTSHQKRWVSAMRLGVLRLLFVLARDWEIPSSTPGQSSVHPSALERLASALSLVQSREGHPVRLREGAAACQLSDRHFCAVFRRAMGVSFGKYVLRFRLGRGAESLLASNAPVEVIAKSLGFVDASHFHRAFVKLYGCTPDRYRGVHFHRKA
jgi:AraC-like DNA-binding protein